MKRKITQFVLILVFTSFLSAQAQLDTSNGRYYNQLFSNVTTTSNVIFGSYTASGFQTNLTMDIYEPTGDAVLMRPLIVWAHGGSFQFGDKNEADIVSMCQTFAKMGYVCCSINYRTGFLPIDSVNATKAVLKATQDMRAAVRFFRQDAATSNTYKIHPDYIYVGGSSAGAFMALHLAYMDKPSEFPLGLSVLNSMGGMEGNSGNPGFPSNASAVINLCGALGNASYIESGDIPFVSMHGNADNTVPYGHAIIVSLGFSLMYVDGSSALHTQANNLGINNPFYTFNGADHVPYLNDAAYLDTTVKFVRDFLRPLVAAAPLKVNDKLPIDKEVLIYPNPSQGDINVDFDFSKNPNLAYELFDASGRKVQSGIFSHAPYTLSRAGLAPGFYFVKLSNKQKTIAVEKISLN